MTDDGLLKIIILLLTLRIILLYKDVITMSPRQKKQRTESTFSLNEEVGFLIRKLRASRKMSGEQLAQIVGISQQQISRYENGKTKLTIDQLEVISTAFDMSIWRFMNILQFNSYIEKENCRNQIKK
jgi:predicted transcriptional regulator